MTFFNPHDYAVHAAPQGTRVTIEGKPLTAYGKVRRVYLVPRDLPFRMVCFSVVEAGRILGLKNPSHPMSKGLFPQPHFMADDLRLAPARTNVTKIRVFIYPEIEIMDEVNRDAKRRIGTTAFTPAFDKGREVMLQRLSEIRSIAMEG